MKIRLYIAAAVMSLTTAGSSLKAQDALYGNTFHLGDVQLLEGSLFRKACDVNIHTLLQYDTDRLLQPFLKEAGLTPKGEPFANWSGLDGHVGGHYLSALAIHYAATGNEECRNRMEYMIGELQRCQESNGDGYLCGMPDGRKCWDSLRLGNVEIVKKYWVPWYNIHKIYAGLRDAWMYGRSGKARTMFLSLCDWGLGVIAPLSDEQMERMLDEEFGGMDEVYADAYQMSGDVRYLDAAKRFSHHVLLDSMAAGVDNLGGKHANTQVPKVVGYQRIAELSAVAGRTDDAKLYAKAAEFFWRTVVGHHTLSFGGSGRREFFAPEADMRSYVTDREGPESCNTYNMLKLTEGLFRLHPDARYADFYERGMLNHILSSHHPEHGGYVYFTSARPAHYRVYSAPNSAMWCCVGSGMENHGKYGEFIYTHTGDSLYVNLFVASRLSWKDSGVELTQQTDFPNEEGTTLTVKLRKSKQFKLMIRRPWWCVDGEMKVTCGGHDYAASSHGAEGYVVIDRKWRNGDVVKVEMPMKVTVEELRGVPEYISIMRGPVVLGARFGTDGLDGLVADDGRWSHIARGVYKSAYEIPTVIGSREEIMEKLQNMKPVAGRPLTYTVPGLFESKYSDLQLEPFYGIHDCRYIVYWLNLPEETPEAFFEEE